MFECIKILFLILLFLIVVWSVFNFFLLLMKRIGNIMFKSVSELSVILFLFVLILFILIRNWSR